MPVGCESGEAGSHRIVARMDGVAGEHGEDHDQVPERITAESTNLSASRKAPQGFSRVPDETLRGRLRRIRAAPEAANDVGRAAQKADPKRAARVESQPPTSAPPKPNSKPKALTKAKLGDICVRGGQGSNGRMTRSISRGMQDRRPRTILHRRLPPAFRARRTLARFGRVPRAVDGILCSARPRRVARAICRSSFESSSSRRCPLGRRFVVPYPHPGNNTLHSSSSSCRRSMRNVTRSSAERVELGSSVFGALERLLGVVAKLADRSEPGVLLTLFIARR